MIALFRPLVIPLVFALLLQSCQKIEKEEIIETPGGSVVLQAFSKQTIETTLRFGEFYYKSNESSEKKYFFGNGSPGVDIFPTQAHLTGVNYTILDSTYLLDNRAPDSRESTLYLDPEFFTKDDYQAMVNFLKQPVEYKKLIRWLDDFVLGLEPGHHFYSIYAVVYGNIRKMETKFSSTDGKEFLIIRVNDKVSVTLLIGDLPSTSLEGYFIRNDTLYYPSYEANASVKRLLPFRSSDNIPFGSIVKILTPIPSQ